MSIPVAVAPARAITVTTASTTAAAPGTAAAPSVKLVPPAGVKPGATIVGAAAPSASAVNGATSSVAPPTVIAPAAVTVASENEAALSQEAAAVAPKSSRGPLGLPIWAWVAIGVVVLLIVLAIVGEVIRRRRTSGGGAYTLVANSNPVCDLSDNKCDVASGTTETSADACKARCDATTGCTGVLYDRLGTLGGANCWVKRFNAVPPRTEPWNGADFYYKTSAATSSSR
jgi:hypothetical protein